MKNLEYTFTVYKNLLNPVLGTRKLNQTGFFHLHPSIKNREYPTQETRTLQLNGEMLLNPAEYGAYNENLGNSLCSAVRFRCSLQSIKGRVERDCLNVSENKTEILSNTYSAKAGLPAPTSEDNCCMMRVIKETGIEKKCGRPENEGRPIKVRNNDSKLTLKFNLYRLFTAFQL